MRIDITDPHTGSKLLRKSSSQLVRTTNNRFPDVFTNENRHYRSPNGFKPSLCVRTARPCASWQPSAAGTFLSHKWTLSERFVEGESVLPICTPGPKWLQASSPTEFSVSRLWRFLIHYWRMAMTITAGETLCYIHDNILENREKLWKCVLICPERMATVSGEFKKVSYFSKLKEIQLI